MELAYEIRGSVNTAVQYAGVAALNGPQSVVKKIVRESDQRRKLLVKLLRQAGFECHMPEGGYETFPKVPVSFGGSMELTKYLAEKVGVIVKPGVFFGPDGDRYFRVVYCVDDKVIRKGMARVARAMKPLKNA